MAVSRKISEFMEQGSWIRKMFEDGIVLKQQFGEENVFDLSLGNPVMEPPQEFFDALCDIAKEPISGMHRYMPNAGLESTRAAVAQELCSETGLDFDTEDILMTVGAGGALNVIMKTLLDPDDEVVIFSPYFVEYFFYADNHGAKCSVVPCDDRFIPDLKVLASLITPKTRMVLTSSPNNPSGIVYDSQLLSTIGEVIKSKEQEYGSEIFLVSDEPYRKILFDGMEYPHIYRFHPRSIVATSHSKDLALPGERIGFIAVNPDCDDKNELVDGLTFCNRTLGFVNAPALMQHLVARLQSVTIDVSKYQAQRDFLYDALTAIGYNVVKPGGAFYMFPKAPIENDVAFVDELRKHKVLVVPGSGFGMQGYFRVSYCVTDATLGGAIDGFRDAFDTFT
jgi:aspartate aminotransferase